MKRVDIGAPTSSPIYPVATGYPDRDKIAVRTKGREDNIVVRRLSGVDYFDGET